MTTRPFAVFLADAAPSIGGGHVMRCLTLAEQLTRAGWATAFASWPDATRTVPALAQTAELFVFDSDRAPDAGVLAQRWRSGCDVLVVDHYGLDRSFEAACRPWARKLLVIDDLADRHHDCDLVLDQTLGRQAEAYRALVPSSCRLLVGTDYALLRPQFAETREVALARRAQDAPVRRILVAMGLGDPEEATGLVLDGIDQSGLDVTVDVVMGASAHHLARIDQRAAAMTPPARMHVGTADVATLMAEADLAFGAAGTTSWERCCLGLPSIMITIAANQDEIARQLGDAGAARLLGARSSVTPLQISQALCSLAGNPQARRHMSARAAEICDGRGAQRVCRELSA